MLHKFLVAVAALLLAQTGVAMAQSEYLIEHDTGRKVDGASVLIRAVVVGPAQPAKTALLYFRGVPGYALIRAIEDKNRNMIPLVRLNLPLLHANGIALVIMDCPTDQWGEAGSPVATKCLDDYRASKQHADDVRGIMSKLTNMHGFKDIYLFGHSMGTLSSRWLAVNLGNEVTGSIHSAATNVPNRKGDYASAARIPYNEIKAPALHIHNEADACRGTPYDIVKKYAGSQLITVRGGVSEGNPCGGGHLHSYQGMEPVVGKAIVDWIKDRKIMAIVEK